MNYSQFYDILLDSKELDGAFSKGALKVLSDVKTLQTLFLLSDKEEFYDYRPDEMIKKEIINTTKLLRCKYLGSKIAININDINSLTSLFTNRTKNAILRTSKITPKDLFDSIKYKDFSKFFNLRTIGYTNIQEIRFKMQIIYDMYEKEIENGEIILDPIDELGGIINSLEISEYKKEKMLQLLNQIKQNNKKTINK